MKCYIEHNTFITTEHKRNRYETTYILMCIIIKLFILVEINNNKDISQRVIYKRKG